MSSGFGADSPSPSEQRIHFFLRLTGAEREREWVCREQEERYGEIEYDSSQCASICCSTYFTGVERGLARRSWAIQRVF